MAHTNAPASQQNAVNMTATSMGMSSILACNVAIRTQTPNAQLTDAVGASATTAFGGASGSGTRLASAFGLALARKRVRPVASHSGMAMVLTSACWDTMARQPIGKRRARCPADPHSGADLDLKTTAPPSSAAKPGQVGRESREQ